MGSQSSKPVKNANMHIQRSDLVNRDGLEDGFERISISEKHHSHEDVSQSLDVETTAKWEEQLLSDPKNRLALAALTPNAAVSILQNPASLLAGTHVFNHKVETEGSPVTNQRSSGRCWLFATTNVLRVAYMKKLKLSSFEFSQNYLFFWDKLEKANWFLEQIIDTAAEPVDSRLVSTLTAAPVGDGGQWDMAVNVIEKYGIVPQKIYPDSFNSKASAKINSLITTKLREAAFELRRIAIESNGHERVSALSSYKIEIVKQVYGILVLTLGVPPNPSEKFTWDYTDKDGKFGSVTATPLEFYHDHVGYKAAEHFSLVNDPRNSYLKHMTVERLGNVVGGMPVRYINAEMDVLKQAAIAMIKKNIPVFFGCDVGKYSDYTSGVLDPDLYLYELAFNVKLSMDKAQRLKIMESQMTHAMVLTGVHIVDGEPVRWRIENSWGDSRGEKGYLVMTDKWMDEYVYQVVTSKEFVTKEVADVLKQDPLVLPLWDPMGALA